MPVSPAQLRAGLVRTLWIGGVLLAILAVVVLLWGWLAALGDQAAADAVRGIACVVAGLAGINVLALLVLLTLATLSSLDRDS